MGNEVAVIRDYDIRDRKLVDATAQSTINSTDAIEMKTTDGNQVFIDKASFIKAVGQAFTASDPKTFTKLLGMNGDGPMGIGASDLASVLGVSALWNYVLGKYIPIEYLESDSSGAWGAQGIDTLFSPNQDTSVMLDCMYVRDISVAPFYFGNERATATLGRYSLLFEDANKPRSDYNKSLVLMSSKQVKNQRATLYKNKNITYIDGNQVAISTYGAFQTDGNMYLYGTNTSGGLSNGFSGLRIYSCKIYDNDTLVRDFIPVRVDQVGYMYDKVSGQLFANQGTGNFVLGPDL